MRVRCPGAASLLLVSLACSDGRASRQEAAAFLAARGTLTAAETSRATPRGRYHRHRIALASSTGLRATGWLFRPQGDTACLPAVLLQDGRELNSEVIDRLPAEFGDVIVLALDYPSGLPYTIELADVLRRSEQLEADLRETPALFLLGVEYLRARPDVDSTRVAVAATSFAVPFASIAAAADAGVANLALIYGAGDLPSVLAANLRLRPSVLRTPLAHLATRPFAALAPERFIGQVAPRPIVMVNGADDPQMPASAVRRLFDAAGEPKELVWLRTGHLMPSDTALIRRLVDTAFARMPVLQQPPGTGCYRRSATAVPAVVRR